MMLAERIQVLMSIYTPIETLGDPIKDRLIGHLHRFAQSCLDADPVDEVTALMFAALAAEGAGGDRDEMEDCLSSGELAWTQATAHALSNLLTVLDDNIRDTS